MKKKKEQNISNHQSDKSDQKANTNNRNKNINNHSFRKN